MPKSSTPISSYRFQLHKDFTFDDAIAEIPRLAKLGINHIQLSPITEAMPGSLNGYDVKNYGRINPELGGRKGFDRLAKELRKYGMKVILDIVPNHMSTGSLWFQDVLANGLASKYAHYFDIDWKAKGKLRGKVLIPVLGDEYPAILDYYKDNVVPREKKILLQRVDGDLRVTYYDHSWPLSPATKAALEKRIAADPGALEHINENSDQLKIILDQQNYVLAHHSQKNLKHNHRIFFDVATLVGVRTELREVLEAQLTLIKSLAKTGIVAAVRVDHIDGLRNPRQFTKRLKKHLEVPVLAFVEKILGHGETIRDDWAVDGDSGYRFMSSIGPLMTDPRNNEAMSHIYEHFIGETRDYHAMGKKNKHLTTGNMLFSQLKRVTKYLKEPLRPYTKPAGFNKNHVREAVDEIAAHFPHYRSYVQPNARKNKISQHDRDLIATALEGARKHKPELTLLIDRIGDVLLLKDTGTLQSEFVERFQQFLPAVMAKGIEDTTFFGFNRMIGENEVGADPSRHFDSYSPAVAIAQFHDANAETQKNSPYNLNNLSTHDTKLSEGVRARLGLLSQIPEKWQHAATCWHKHNAAKKTDGWPDSNTEYAIYQTLVGGWPLEEGRLQDYIQKRIREAKEFTRHDAHDDAYESAVSNFITQLYQDETFQQDLKKFTEPLIAPGYRNGLIQTALKTTSPGSPEIYQGNEIWTNRLVDPDNRRPVHYPSLHEAAAELRRMPIEERMKLDDSGMAKMWVIAVGNALRAEYPHAMGPKGSYKPLTTSNGKAETNVVAYARGDSRGPNVLTIAQIMPLSEQDLGNTTLELPPGSWCNRLTGATYTGGTKIAIADLLQNGNPVAFLARPDFATKRDRPSARLKLLGALPKNTQTPDPKGPTKHKRKIVEILRPATGEPDSLAA